MTQCLKRLSPRVAQPLWPSRGLSEAIPVMVRKVNVLRTATLVSFCIP
jgi:hypothetical protein